MKLFKATLMLLSTFILFTAHTPAKKFEYKTDEGKFSVVFPGEFTSETEQGESTATTKTMCSYEEATYFASFTIHETEITDHAEMAEVSYESFISTVGGELLSRSGWEVDGNKGLKAVMDLKENGVKLEYRVLLIGNIQYQLIAMAAYSDYDEKAAEKFFGSFKLID